MSAVMLYKLHYDACRSVVSLSTIRIVVPLMEQKLVDGTAKSRDCSRSHAIYMKSKEATKSTR